MTKRATTRDLTAWEPIREWLAEHEERQMRIHCVGRVVALVDESNREVDDLIRPGESPWTAAGRALAEWARR